MYLWGIYILFLFTILFFLCIYGVFIIFFFFYGNTGLGAFVSTKNSEFLVPRIVLLVFSVNNKRFRNF